MNSIERNCSREQEVFMSISEFELLKKLFDSIQVIEATKLVSRNSMLISDEDGKKVVLMASRSVLRELTSEVERLVPVQAEYDKFDIRISAGCGIIGPEELEILSRVRKCFRA